MAFFSSRPNLSDIQFKQNSDDTLTLSGKTNIIGKLCVSNIRIDVSAANSQNAGHVLTYNGTDIVLLPGTATENAFDSKRPTTRSGIPSITANGSTIKDFLEAYFFPSVPPTVTITPTDNQQIRQFGNDTPISLNWAIIKNTNNITSINVNGTSIAPNGGNQTGTLGNQSPPSDTKPTGTTSQTQQTYSITVNTSLAGETVTQSTTISWQNKRYWFKSSTLYNDASATAQLTTILNELTTCEFATTKAKLSFNNATLFNNEYFYYVYPQSFGTPTFKTLTGELNSWGSTTYGTLYTISFTNSNGYARTYYVARSQDKISGNITITAS